MKRVLTVLVMVALGFAAKAQTATAQPQEKKESKVSFKEVTYDFGEIEYGGDGTHTFAFKNVSKVPVTITNVGTSCGCTTPSYSKEPVSAGKDGSVTAKYDTSRIGSFYKTLTVNFEGEDPITLTIKGTVKQKPEEKAN